MAIKSVRIGSMEDCQQYDDAVYDSAIETSAPIKAGPPIDANDVLRKTDIGTLVTGPAGATDHAVARFSGATGFTIQNSLVTIGDTGSISLPAGETVDGKDISTLATASAVGAHTIPLLKLTGGGVNGSITFNAEGIVTGYVDPT